MVSEPGEQGVWSGSEMFVFQISVMTRIRVGLVGVLAGISEAKEENTVKFPFVLSFGQPWPLKRLLLRRMSGLGVKRGGKVC